MGLGGNYKVKRNGRGGGGGGKDRRIRYNEKKPIESAVHGD